MGHVTLLCLVVTMATAAPTVERGKDEVSKEPAVSFSSLNTKLDRTKRAKEEVAYGNQQSGAKDTASAVKRSMPFMTGLNSQPLRLDPFQFPSPIMRPLELSLAGVPASSKGYGADFLGYSDGLYGTHPAVQGAEGRMDKAGYVYASEQVPLPVVPAKVKEEMASEFGNAAPPALMPGDPLTQERETNGEVPELKTPASAASVMNKETNREPSAKIAMGQEPPREDLGNNDRAEEAAEEIPDEEMVDQTPASALPAAEVVVEPEVPALQTSRLPEDSRAADAEEILHAQDQVLERDDIDNFLDDLRAPKEPMISYESGVKDEVKQQQGGAFKEEAKMEGNKEDAEEEGSAEAELMQVQNEATAAEAAETAAAAESAAMMQKGQAVADDAAENTSAADDYRKQLLEYILLNRGNYGRVPASYSGRSYPQPYPPSSYGFLQRRRRSLPHHHTRLPHINHQESKRRIVRHLPRRARRTKRDLFDDQLYYNADATARQYALERAVEEEEAEKDAEEEEEKQAELAELISYLMSMYTHQPTGGPSSPYLWNLWRYPSGYHSEGYLNYPGLEGGDSELQYSEVLPPQAIADWEPPTSASRLPVAPAWEPTFYPEEVQETLEEPSYYPPPALAVKRGMMDYAGERLRKRYFFPYDREPYAHWGAFVPTLEKRDYQQAYQRLRDLATVLAEADARAQSTSLPHFDAFINK